jgi:hypothetical protein
MTKRPPDPPPRRTNEPAEDEFADLDTREALFTGALAQADRVSNRAAAMRRQVMLAGFDAMVLEEQQGRTVRMDDMIVRSFLLHQATVLRLPRQTVEHQLADGWMLRDQLPATWAVFLEGGCSEAAASIAAEESGGLAGDLLVAYDLAASQLVQGAAGAGGEAHRPDPQARDVPRSPRSAGRDGAAPAGVQPPSPHRPTRDGRAGVLHDQHRRHRCRGGVERGPAGRDHSPQPGG